MIGGDPLHHGGQHPPRALLAFLLRVALDLAHAVLRLRLGLVHDLADEALARLGGGQTGHPLELLQLPLAEIGDLGALAIQLRGTRLQALLAFLECRDLTIERLLPVQESALGTLHVRALLARLVLGRAPQVERLVLALEDDLLLLRVRLGNDALAVLLGMLHGARRDEAARDEADHDADDHGDRSGRHDDHDKFRHLAPPCALEPGYGRCRTR